MRVVDTEIAEVKILEPRRFGDARGVFCETYSRKALAGLGVAGLDVEFVQDNQSRSDEAGCVRGLHFQLPPFAQGKLVRVLRGSVLDVAVDLRRASPTFGRHVSVMLSAENWLQLFVPAGFAHGFCTLEPGTEVAYKVTNYYSPQHDRGVLWDDPELGIVWPAVASAARLSEKDRKLPRLRDAGEIF